MKKIRTLFIIGLALLMLLPSVVSAAPYKTYTYTPDGEILISPDAYVPDLNVDAAYMDLRHRSTIRGTSSWGPTRRCTLRIQPTTAS